MRTTVFALLVLTSCSYAVLGVPREEPVAATPPPTGSITATDDPDLDASIDAAPSDAGDADAELSSSQLYAALCVTPLASREPSQALRFYAVLHRHDGLVSLELKPLIGWDQDANTFVSPAAVSLEHTTEGGGISTSVPSTGGAQLFSFPNDFEVPAKANSISGRHSVFEDWELNGALADAGDWCAALSAKLVEPYKAELKASDNTCLLVPVDAGAPLPERDGAAFDCP